MRKPLSLSVRVGTVLVICGVVPLANGCRSTRSSLSGLPGLAWVAPSDDDAKFGGWSEDDGPTLPPPSAAATPQLASKSGVTSLEAPNRRAVATSAESSARNAYAQASYPDTGYDAPYDDSTSSASPRTASATAAGTSPRGPAYATGNYDAAAGRVAAATKNAQPRRGFYSDDYPTEDESPTAAATSDPVSRYGEDEFSSSASSSARSSRYGDDASYGRYGETDNAGYGRYGESSDTAANSAAGAVANAGAGPSATASRWADDAAGSYKEDAAGMGRNAGEPVEHSKSLASSVASDLKNSYDNASSGVRNRLSAGAESLIEKGRSLGREADSTAQRTIGRAGDTLEARAASPSATAEGRYEDLANEADHWRDEVHGAGDDLRSAVTEGSRQARAKADEYEDAAGDSRWADDPAPPSSGSSAGRSTATPARAAQPWRPGSTGRSGGASSVRPASYDASDKSSSRFAPSYR